MTTITRDADKAEFEIPEMDALEVLRQAGDMIAVSYWTARKEADFASDFSLTEVDESIPLKSKGKIGLKGKKGIAVFHAYNISKSFVTRACSVGAIGMARLTAYVDDETRPYVAFYEMASKDLPTRLAAEALAETVRAHFPDLYPGAPGDETYSIITQWNDDTGRTREEVERMFRDAESSPWLTATEVWVGEIASKWRDHHYQYKRFPFRSEREAREAYTCLLDLDRETLTPDQAGLVDHLSSNGVTVDNIDNKIVFTKVMGVPVPA